MDVDAQLHDLRQPNVNQLQALDADSYAVSQTFAAQLQTTGSGSLVRPSTLYQGGEAVGLFYPDLATNPVQGRHLEYHWNGTRFDLYHNPSCGHVFWVVHYPEA